MPELLNLTFLRPWWLLALIPAGLVLVALYRHGWQHSAWEQLLPQALQPALLTRHPGTGQRLRFVALGITLLLACLALAGPAQHSKVPSQRVDDRALVIILDLSRHMLSNDLSPNRLERARLKIRGLIQEHADSQLSLIVYAGSAHRVTPLSTDHATLTNLLGALHPAIMPVDGQALDNALSMAREAIAQRPRSSSHILLLTSGLDSDNQQHLAAHASALGSQLSILGVGTRAGAPVPLTQGGFLRDADGRILLPRLNSEQLASLARQHGARYHNISAGDRDLDYLLQPLQSNHRTISSEHRALLDQGHWLVLLLLPIAALGARRGWLGAVFCAALLPLDAQALSWTDLWQRADQQAMQLLDNDQPAAAAQGFSDPAWRAFALHQSEAYQEAADAWAALGEVEPDEPEHHFNQGTALALAGDYQGALLAYEHTLTLAPEHDGARHNRKAVEDYLEWLRQEQDQQASSAGEQEAGADQDQPGASAATGSAAADTPDTHGEDPGSSTGPGQTGAADGAADTLSNGTLQDLDPGTDSSIGNGHSSSASTDMPTAAELERQQALQQWLQDIPDDPAELLRRKFLYQHLQQQDVAP